MRTVDRDTHQSTRRNIIGTFLSFVGSTSLIAKIGAAGSISAVGLSTGCMGETSYDKGDVTAFEPFWAYRADRLEQYQKDEFGVDVRSMDAPGEYNPTVHHPDVRIDNNILNVTVDHVMQLDHWITTIYARDINTGRVFFLKEFHPTEASGDDDKGASISTPFPAGVTRFAVFAFCNKHELWWSGEINLG